MSPIPSEEDQQSDTLSCDDGHQENTQPPDILIRARDR
jgi:hypothetical protein